MEDKSPQRGFDWNSKEPIRDPRPPDPNPPPFVRILVFSSFASSCSVPATVVFYRITPSELFFFVFSEES